LRRVIYTIIILSSLAIADSFDLRVKEGIDQDIIRDVVPKYGQEDTSSDVVIEVEFNSRLDSSIKDKNIVVTFLGYRFNDKELKGKLRDMESVCKRYSNNKDLLKDCHKISNLAWNKLKKNQINNYQVRGRQIVEDSKIRFIPAYILDKGYYEVVIKDIKTKEAKSIKKIRYRFKVDNSSLKDIDISANKVLNVGEKQKIKLKARYIDNNSSYYHDRSTEANYYIADSDIVAIGKEGSFIPKKQGETIAISSYHNRVSLPVLLEVEEVINGYKLPAEPDLKESDTTLEGIDTNSNGIRDDVERKIIKRYKHNKLATALLLSGAKQYQAVLEQPLSNAQEIRKEISRVISCKVALIDFDKEIESDDFLISTILGDLTYNRRDRTEKFLEYNYALSGDSYGGSIDEERVEVSCDQNIQDILKEINR
jgi:hypothetical protein